MKKKHMIKKAMRKTMTMMIMSSLLAIAGKLLPRLMSHEKIAEAEGKIDAAIDEKTDAVRDMSKKGAHKTFAIIEGMAEKQESLNTKSQVSAAN